MVTIDDFEPWLTRWSLTPDGEPFSSLAGKLLPVVKDGAPAMLKLSHAPEEVRGGALMEWWAGEGAARVLAREYEALLLERATGGGSLAAMARNGEDAKACRILCRTAKRLHAPRAQAPPATLVPLESWFRELWPSAEARGGVFARSAAIARDLLARQAPPAVLHGDIHHGNVLDFGTRGWLAIDPKGLFGDPGYDYANMLCNPGADVALSPGVFERRVTIAAEVSGSHPRRVLEWLIAYAGLSASWTLSEGNDPWQAIAIAERAAAELLD
jgi:streptomycin 6-kinase